MKENTAVTITTDDLDFAIHSFVTILKSNGILEYNDRQYISAATDAALDNTVRRLSGKSWEELTQEEEDRLVAHQDELMSKKEIGYVVCQAEIRGKEYEWNIPLSELRAINGSCFEIYSIDQLLEIFKEPGGFVFLLDAIRAPELTYEPVIGCEPVIGYEHVSGYGITNIRISQVVRPEHSNDDGIDQAQGERRRLYDLVNNKFKTLSENYSIVDFVREYENPRLLMHQAVDKATAMWIKQNAEKYFITFRDHSGKDVDSELENIGLDYLKWAVRILASQ